MAVAVIVGIMFATFLTLILVPVLYSLVDDFTAFFRSTTWFRVDEAESGSEAVPEGVKRLETGVPAFEPAPEPEACARVKSRVRIHSKRRELQASNRVGQSYFVMWIIDHLGSDGSSRRRYHDEKNPGSFLPLLAASVLLPTSISGQQEGEDVRAGALTVYLECDGARGCESSHFRTEITYVNWVRDLPTPRSTSS